MSFFSFIRNLFHKDDEALSFVTLKYGTPDLGDLNSIQVWMDSIPDEAIRRAHIKLMKLDIILSPITSALQSRTLIRNFMGHSGFCPKVLKSIQQALIEHEHLR